MRFPWDKELNEKTIKVLDLRQGIEHLLEYFEGIYTTDSICSIEHEKLKIHKL